MRLDQDKKKFVEGGKVWTHFNVRCPLCSKLYRIDSRDLASQEPHFNCRVCKGVFSFQNPPPNINKVECKIISTKAPEELQGQSLEENSKHFKKCPKCHALNPRALDECQKCHVIFSKIPVNSDIQGMPNSQVIYSGLTRAWKDIFRDYSNISKHLAFVDQCDDLRALPYALKKYQELKDAQPHDQIVTEMVHRLKMRELAQKIDSSPWLGPIGRKGRAFLAEFFRRLNLPRLKKMLPWVSATAMIVIGSFSRGQRNFVGLGVAILFLWVGIKIFHRGKISLSDFY